MLVGHQTLGLNCPGKNERVSWGDLVIARRPLLAGYVGWWTALVVAYYALPGLRTETWGLLGLTGVVAIVAGVRLHRPARKVSWLLLAAANLSFVAGQVSFLVATNILHRPMPFPSYADVLYLATYPLYAAGLSIFIWARTPNGDRRSVIDALTLTVGLALISWMYLILPYVHNPQLSWLQKAVAIAYPLGDVLVLAMLARLRAPAAARRFSCSPWDQWVSWPRTPPTAAWCCTARSTTAPWSTWAGPCS